MLVHDTEIEIAKGMATGVVMSSDLGTAIIPNSVTGLEAMPARFTLLLAP
jgi:hypothetical protein